MFLFDTTFKTLPSIFYNFENADKIENPKLIKFNKSLASDLLDDPIEKITENKIISILTGNFYKKDQRPIAMKYAGHQFGHYNPDLGDGRALLLGEVLDKENNRFDIVLKGSGRTKYSRNGDGKSPLGPVIREYLISEAMFHLKIPTTRSLAIIQTNEYVYRENKLMGGILTRVAKGHIRVGSFEYFYQKNDTQNLKILFDYSINRFFPEINNHDEKYLEFLKLVIQKQANLIAKWLGVGFIHGVMNTDNMLVSGETIDYGPCAFMDHYNPKQVFSYIDQHGRYNYSNQIDVAKWNLCRLAECIIPILKNNNINDSIKNIENLIEKEFKLFDFEKLKIFSSKLGIENHEDQDKNLISKWHDYLVQNNLDFTNSYRKLSDDILVKENETKEFSYEYQDFLNHLKKRILEQNKNLQDSAILMDQVNPYIIPRNHLVEEAIFNSYKGDFELFNKLNKLYKSPFEKQNLNEKYTSAPNKEQRIIHTFCGT